MFIAKIHSSHALKRAICFASMLVILCAVILSSGCSSKRSDYEREFRWEFTEDEYSQASRLERVGINFRGGIVGFIDSL